MARTHWFAAALVAAALAGCNRQAGSGTGGEGTTSGAAPMDTATGMGGGVDTGMVDTALPDTGGAGMRDTARTGADTGNP